MDAEDLRGGTHKLTAETRRARRKTRRRETKRQATNNDGLSHGVEIAEKNTEKNKIKG